MRTKVLAARSIVQMTENWAKCCQLSGHVSCVVVRHGPRSRDALLLIPENLLSLGFAR
jgi:hypothetical protein